MATYTCPHIHCVSLLVLLSDPAYSIVRITEGDLKKHCIPESNGGCYWILRPMLEAERFRNLIAFTVIERIKGRIDAGEISIYKVPNLRQLGYIESYKLVLDINICSRTARSICANSYFLFPFGY